MPGFHEPSGFVYAVVALMPPRPWRELPLVVPDTLLSGALSLRETLGARLVAATTGSDAVPLERFRRPAHLLLALGSESEGLSPELLAAADARVTVPLEGGVDSLNVAAATAVLLHALR